MKKVLAIGVIVAFGIGSVMAKAGIGVYVSESYTQQSTKYPSTSYNQTITWGLNELDLGLFVPIKPTSLIEINPGMEYTYRVTSAIQKFEYSSSTRADTTSKMVSSQHSFQFQTGIYFHLLENNFLSFSIGPRPSIAWFTATNTKLGDDKYAQCYKENWSIGLAAMSNLDFNFSDNFTLRLSSKLLDISTQQTKSTDDNGPDNSQFYLNGYQPLSLNIGVLFTF